MKLWPANADPDALPNLRAPIMVRATRWGIVAQLRPRKKRRNFTKLQRQYQQRFAFAARMASNPHPLDYATAIEMAKGTEQVPRDVLTMAALGRYYEVILPDGQTMGHVPGAILHEPEKAPMAEAPTDFDLQYHAGKGVNLSGSLVLSWDDQTAGARHVSAPAGKEPTHTADADGTGHPGLIFQGGKCLARAWTEDVFPVTRFAVFSARALAGQFIWDGQTASGRLALAASTTSRTELQTYSRLWSAHWLFPPFARTIVAINYDPGANYGTTIDGTTTFTRHVSSHRRGITIGAMYNTSRFADMTLHELRDYPRKLTDAEISATLNALADEWL